MRFASGKLGFGCVHQSDLHRLRCVHKLRCGAVLENDLAGTLLLTREIQVVEPVYRSCP